MGGNTKKRKKSIHQNFPEVVNSKGKKFYVKKIPRYLIASGNGGMVWNDLKEYNKHRYKCFTATPKVDSTPPKFHFDNSLGKTGLQDDKYALRRIEQMNQQLLKRINLINRTQGFIDSWNHYANCHTSRWDINIQRYEKINKDNRNIYKTLLNVEPAYPKCEHDQHWKRMMHKMKLFCKYPIVIIDQTTVDQQISKCPSISSELTTDVDPENISKRPKVFLEFKIDNGIVLGKVIIQLYNDIAPDAAEHFMNLCSAKGKKSFKKCNIPLIKINKYVIAGDSSNFNGKGKTITVENNQLLHSRPGVVSVIPHDENNEIGAQFCITLDRSPDLDNKFIVIGKIVHGMKYLFKLGQFGTWHGFPVTKMIISNSGIHVSRKKKHTWSRCK